MIRRISHSSNSRQHLRPKVLACIAQLFLISHLSLLTSHLLLLTFTACSPEPPLHLFESKPVENKIIFAELELDTYWDYELEFGIKYDWRAEWYYGWDEEDVRIFGDIGYTLPNVFNIRRYSTGNVPYAPHTKVIANTITGTTFQGEFTWGFWDMLVFNDVVIHEGAQSLVFDETSSLDSISVFTNMSMSSARYHAPKYVRAFYQPEELFSAYEQAIEINRDLDGFEYDPERNIWIKRMNMVLRPITFIYLTQVIIHNNRGKVVGVDGNANLSGMARSSVLNSGRAGEDAIAVNYNTRWKTGCEKHGEKVDIAGGRLMTFGICGQRSNAVKNIYEVHDPNNHFMDVTLLFNNGMDSTFVFDVTEQVHRRYKGGVLTVEMDLDTIAIPSRSGGSAFDAVVKDYEEVTHEFEM